MAQTGKGTKVFVDKWDFSAEGRSVDISVDQDVIDCTTFSAEAKCVMGGLIQAKVDYKGIWNKDDSDGLDAYLTSNLGVLGKGITVIPGEPAEGGVAYHGEILNTTKPVAVPFGDLITLDAGFTINGPLGRGTVLAHKATATGPFNGTAYDMGMAASGYCCLTGQQILLTTHCFGYVGTGNYTVRVDESDDGTNLSSFSVLTSSYCYLSGVTNAIVSRVDGPVKRYIRAKAYRDITSCVAQVCAVASVVNK